MKFLIAFFLATSSMTSMATPNTVLKQFKSQAQSAGLSEEGYYHDAVLKGDTDTVSAIRDAATGGDVAFFQKSLNEMNRPEQNYMLNGAFNFWQRGTSGTLTAAYSYLADQYRAEAIGSGISVAVARSTDVPNSGFKYSIQATSGGTEVAMAFAQPLEAANIRSLVGQTVTFSAWVKSVGDGNGDVNIAVYTPTSGEDNWATGGRITANTLASSTTFDVGTSTWTRAYYSFVVPSGAANGMAVAIYDNAGSAQQLFSTGWQLAKGESLKNFEPAGTYQHELSQLQRYYEKSYSTTANPGVSSPTSYDFMTGTFSDSIAYVTIPFKTEKRTNTYSVSFYQLGGSAGIWNYIRNGASGTTTMATGTKTTNSMVIKTGNIGAAWSPADIYGHWVVENAL